MQTPSHRAATSRITLLAGHGWRFHLFDFSGGFDHVSEPANRMPHHKRRVGSGCSATACGDPQGYPLRCRAACAIQGHAFAAFFLSSIIFLTFAMNGDRIAAAHPS
jgi:hypothetical protein